MNMKTAFEKALGNPAVFLQNIGYLTDEYLKMRGIKELDFEEIRQFVQTKQGQLLSDAHEFQRVAAAFACVLIDFYAQDLRLAGILRRKLVVKSRHFEGEFLDLFYRCMYEGLDLAPKGEGLPK